SLLVALAEPLVVGPAPRHVEGVALPPAARGDHDRPRPERQGELTRAVREHRPGDPLRHVHWPATARHGRLMSRELGQPGARAVGVVAELGPLGGADAERAAGSAAHAVAGLRDRGAQVELVTRGPTGVVSGPVTSRRGAGRRL